MQNGAKRAACVIQGGLMGVGVRTGRWRRCLAARAARRCVRNRTRSILVRRPQDGDIGGHVRRAMPEFPIPHVGSAGPEPVLLPGGKATRQPYKLLPMYKQTVSVPRQPADDCSRIREVSLAKEATRGAGSASTCSRNCSCRICITVRLRCSPAPDFRADGSGNSARDSGALETHSPRTSNCDD